MLVSFVVVHPEGLFYVVGLVGRDILVDDESYDLVLGEWQYGYCSDG